MRAISAEVNKRNFDTLLVVGIDGKVGQSTTQLMILFEGQSDQWVKGYG